jgi:serine/threonine-protein kinase
MSITELGKGGDLWTLRLGEKGAEPKLEEFLKTDTNEGYGRISPDGRWLAYDSQATGRPEVYVRPYPPSPDRTGQQMVSNNGGVGGALWRKDGRELYYVGSNRSVMMVPVTPGPVLMFGQPKVLFQAPLIANTSSLPSYNWDVNADGSKFLINVVGTGTAGPQLPHVLVLNWTSGLK